MKTANLSAIGLLLAVGVVCGRPVHANELAGRDSPVTVAETPNTSETRSGMLMAQLAAGAADAPDKAPEAQYRPSDLTLLEAADNASGVLSPSASAPANQPNSQPDRYFRSADFLKLPSGRKMGGTAGVAVDSHGNVWVFDRCGTSDCAGSNLDPIMEFDTQGHFVKAFGGGRFLFPHGIFIDSNDHIWVTDAGCVSPPGMGRTPVFVASCTDGRVGDGKGHFVMEFDQDGQVLMTLGKPGVPGDGAGVFNRPSSVLVSPAGNIFVADSHESGPQFNARISKFDPSGKVLKQWGSPGLEAGQFKGPNDLAMDNEGRLYVSDRENNRLQVFDQNGKLLQILTQFGRASGIFVDKNDILYASDSESRNLYGYGYHPGWARGIRIGSVKDGIVTTFIPDTGPADNLTSGGEGMWVDAHGAIYSAEPGQRAVVKFVKP